MGFAADRTFDTAYRHTYGATALFELSKIIGMDSQTAAVSAWAGKIV